jgi:hypothetical protein
MADKEQSRTRSRAQTTPEDFPTTPQQQLPSGDFSYTLEVVMGMQKTLGEHTHAVQTLTEEFKGMRTKVDRLSHIIYAAGVVGTILLGVGVWLLNKVTDVLISHFAAAAKP